MKKFLVAARMDRGGKSVSPERLTLLAKELEFDQYFETSAKEGVNIASLAKVLKSAINWDLLPKVTSTELFQRIKEFLVAEKETGHLLSTSDALYRTFLKSEKSMNGTEDLSVQFETCIGRVESRGLIRR
jgi:hypothetical protein